MWTKDEVADNNILNSGTYTNIVEQNSVGNITHINVSRPADRFVGIAISESPYLVESNDFFSWSYKPVAADIGKVYSYAYKDGVYVCGGSNGFASGNSNLASFQKQYGGQYKFVATNGDVFIACPTAYIPSNNMYISNSGTDWTVLRDRPSFNDQATTASGLIYSCGDIMYMGFQPDSGTDYVYAYKNSSFIKTNLHTNLNESNTLFKFVNNKYTCIIENRLYMSDDGLNFEEITIKNPFCDIDYQNGVYIFVVNNDYNFYTTHDFSTYNITKFTGQNFSQPSLCEYNGYIYTIGSYNGYGYKLQLESIQYDNPSSLFGSILKDVFDIKLAISKLQ